MGEKLVTFGTGDIILTYSSKIGLNNVKYAFAYGCENIYYLLQRKFIPVEEYKNSTEKKTSMSICMKKMTN